MDAMSHTTQVMANATETKLIRWWNDRDGAIVWNAALEAELKLRGYVTRIEGKRVFL